MSDDPIRVLVVDDHRMVRQGLRAFVLIHDDLELVGEAGDGQEACMMYERLHPDVVLMDLVMPRMDGVAATRTLLARDPNACIVALTSFKDEALVTQALEAGARGYLLKDIDADQLAKAIRTAHQGKPALAPEAAWVLFEARSRGPAIGDDLTEREREVLALLVEGLANADIAERLFIGVSTVKTHVSNILSKLNVTTRTEAVSLALQKGLVKKEQE
jgi:two-component system, NarL family, response regulator LiaR